MKKVLFVATDSGAPIKSGFEEASAWAESNKIQNYFITSHRIGVWINAYQDGKEILSETFAYEVCVESD